MMRKFYLFLSLSLFSSLRLLAQDATLPIRPKLKLGHAEPLYVDLIRDLGARKGEREFNVGAGFNDYRNFINYSGFVEYEFAPLNRLGLEIEVPFQFYRAIGTENGTPANKMEGIKLAAQYTFLVSEKHQASLAFGYIHEFKLENFDNLQRGRWMSEMLYNPIFVAAKRWSPKLHTLFYTGPELERNFGQSGMDFSYQLNASIHYVLSGTTKFIGLETNIDFSQGQATVVFRPQVKFGITRGISVGWVTGIPMDFEKEGISSMIRLIWEPKKIQK